MRSELPPDQSNLRLLHVFQCFASNLVDSLERAPITRTTEEGHVQTLSLHVFYPPTEEDNISHLDDPLDIALASNPQTFMQATRLAYRWSDDASCSAPWTALDTLLAWSDNVTHPWTYLEALLAGLETRLTPLRSPDRTALVITFQFIDFWTLPQTHALLCHATAVRPYQASRQLRPLTDGVLRHPLGEVLTDVHCFLLQPMVLSEQLPAFQARFGQQVGYTTPVPKPDGVDATPWKDRVFYALLQANQTTFRTEAWAILQRNTAEDLGDVPTPETLDPPATEARLEAYTAAAWTRAAAWPPTEQWFRNQTRDDLLAAPSVASDVQGDRDERVDAAQRPHQRRRTIPFHHNLGSTISHMVPTAAMVELLIALAAIPCMMCFIVFQLPIILLSVCQIIASRGRPHDHQTPQRTLRFAGVILLFSIILLALSIVFSVVALLNACVQCLRHATHNVRALDEQLERRRKLTVATTVLQNLLGLGLLSALTGWLSGSSCEVWLSLLHHLPGSPTLSHLTLITLGCYLVVRRLLINPWSQTLMVHHPHLKRHMQHRTHAVLGLPTLANVLFTALSACAMPLALEPLHHALSMGTWASSFQVLGTLGACLTLEAMLYLVFQAVMATQQPPIQLYKMDAAEEHSTSLCFTRIMKAAFMRSMAWTTYQTTKSIRLGQRPQPFFTGGR